MTGGGWKLTRAAALLGALALSGFAVTQPQAASGVCRQLEADLAAASRGGGGKPALLRKYDDAIVRQREQISRASRQSDSAGCGVLLLGRNRNACAALEATLDRMIANLDALQVKRAQLADGGSRRDRARILASLDANGCRDSIVPSKRAPVLEANRENGNGNLLDRLLGNVRNLPDALDEPSDPDEERGIRAMIDQPDGMDLPRLGGEFRTMCVRTCDGYFFPMSNAASLGDFERDQKNCDSSCPGTEMQVFYTRGIGDDSADMTSSVTGRPYSELPAAYLYKQPETSRPLACGCNAAQNFEIIAGNPPSPKQTDSDVETTPLPVAKPDPGADPETLANVEGGLDREAIKRLAVKPSPTTLPPPGQRKVRVVGPTFLPDPAAATDLQAPAPKAAP
ncbi:DUF2865 domain-containing protein [Mesorhizobium sp.]|uniref:DUF2865 domain-containing protein n=1 Tax=Mesorhizobium sp. TaxID=1871066 RepID=UPI000FE88C73|nr:DUF2865 domain-containing protein [Mesorhizobium sp.]RWK65961.1 MAG: DUF2865 domain-containing protein [Mesorhizobium sp.]RWM52809.1 MAG: DUF2865 domain-containing protein [Mesorhizobium sp.]RWM60453.1 MAG: DUF2865 domain-containing protein [Mesorhizobium sp.]RWM62351.1 MAG: DUF2865 domain-containing protein [Mesorhizobium sp.]RWN05008.1 MAG: DUF2865 domain-containing protein [Mesorhizobium sp.]